MYVIWNFRKFRYVFARWYIRGRPGPSSSLKKLGSSEAKLSELADHYISRWQRKLEEKYSFVAKPRSQVSESARAFSKNPAPMGIRPGRPSLSAGASWVLPRSPIRYDIWMWAILREEPNGRMALPLDLSSRVTRNVQWQPLNCHCLASLATAVAPSVVSTNRVRATKLTLIHIGSSCYAPGLLLSVKKGGRPFIKAQESAGHLSGGIWYPHLIEVSFY